MKEILHPRDVADSEKLGFSLAYAYLKKGESSLRHQLAFSETYYFLQGQGEIFINEEKSPVEKNDIVFVPAHSRQFVKNTGEEDLVFLCIVSPPWTPASEIIETPEK